MIGFSMSFSQENDESNRKTLELNVTISNLHTKKILDYRREFPLLGQMGYIAKNVDLEKYTYALRELEAYFEKEGYKELTSMFEPIADYNIVVVPYNYKWKSEELIANIVKEVRGWNNIKVTKLTKILLEKADILEKLGHPLQQIVYFIENANTILKIAEIERKTGGISGGVGVGPAHVGGGIRLEKQESVIQYMKGNIETVRTAVSMVLDSIDKPTLLILSDKELEVLGADTILNAVVANRNLVVVVYLPTTPSKEFRKLVVSERTISLNLPVMYASMKSYILNMYREMAKKLRPRFNNVFRRAGTRRNVADTIDLLIEMGLLQKVVGTYLYKIVNPLLVIDATNRVIAKFYALLQRNPGKIRSVYESVKPRMKRLLRNSFSEIIDRLMEEAETETIFETLNQNSIDVIYRTMLDFKVSPEKMAGLLQKNVLKELDYPILFNREDEYSLIEYMRKIGILSLRATRHGYYTLAPGIEHLYKTVRMLLYSSLKLAKNKEE